jgi:hypothetical protein
MSQVESFGNDIYQHILNQYGKTMLSRIQASKHKTLVSKLIDSASNQNDTVEHAANKIIAMLRMNP